MKPEKNAQQKKKVKSAENPRESSSPVDMFKQLQNEPTSDNILKAIAKSSSS